MIPYLRLSLTAIAILLLSYIPAHAAGGRIPDVERVHGRVVDGTTGKAVDYASASILLAARDSMIAGMLTESDGSFSFDNIPAGSYRLRVSFMGYASYDRPFTIRPEDTETDLGPIRMNTGSQKLNEVTITGDKAVITMSLDRKVFNVDKDISSRGGTGLDVMKNIPGVSIDADGNVALRNNTPTVYVDGKPSSLTLDQIPSDQIDRVEVITNPSAKYEAASAGGIVNVIMKQNRKAGYNGIVSALIGTNSQWNGTASGNLHKGKFGFALSFNNNGVSNRTRGFINRISLDDATGLPTGYLDQLTKRRNRRIFHTIRAGIDYYIDKRNTLSLTENMVIGKFTNEIDAEMRRLGPAGADISHGSNYNYESAQRHTFTTNLDFHHTYPTAGKEYSIFINYERFRSPSEFLDTALTYDPSGSLLPGSDGFFAQHIPSGVQSHMVTAQFDFRHPLRDSLRLEYGLRGYYKRQATFANVSNFIDSLGGYQYDPVQSSQFRTDELISAAYVTVAQQVRRFSYQVGMRFEQVYFYGLRADRGQLFSYSYPQSPARAYESFFPSFFLAQRLGTHHILQLNGTRKTSRPRPNQINPNIQVVDQYDYTIGNPALRPEFINQAEMNYNLTLPIFDWLSSLYVTYTEHPITQYSYDSAGILIATFINAKDKVAYGWENTIKLYPVKNLTINLSGNVFYNTIQALPGGTAVPVTNSGFSWMAKAMVGYKFPLGFAAQVNGSYEAPKILPQGTSAAVYYFDISISKEIGIATINLSLSDVMNTKANGTHYVTPDFIQNSSRRREARYAKLGVTFRFGKEEKLIRSKKTKKEGKERDEEE